MNIEKKDLSRSVKTYLNEIASKFSYLELFGNTKNHINVVFMHFISSFRNKYLINNLINNFFLSLALFLSKLFFTHKKNLHGEHIFS